MNTPKTPVRAVRISDDVWDADKDDVTRTDIVRRALVEYLELPADTTGFATDRQRTGFRSSDD